MTISQYQPCDTACNLARLREEGVLLAEAADRAGLSAPVPSCPGWQVRDLLKHTGYVHRWATSYVAGRHEKWVDRSSEAEILRDGPGDESLREWFREGHARLVGALAEADPDLACWTFLPAPSPLAFWTRRQAHETSIHRVDAQQAASGTGASGQTPFPPEFAADGIDELLAGFVARDGERGLWQGPDATFAFRAEDAGGAACWRVVSAPGRCAVERAAGPADCVVAGPAEALYLRLWNRSAGEGLAIEGDPELFAAFRDAAQVTWT